MKESEAKTKWCPMVRIGNSSRNTDPQTPMSPFYACRGSDCMMWEPEYNENVKELAEGSDHPANSHVRKSYKGQNARDGYVFVTWYTQNEYGDCGLKTKESGCFYQG